MKLVKLISAPIYCLIWYISILIGFYFLYAPLLPLLIVHRRSYRRLTDLIFVLWEAFNTALIEVLLGTQIRISGDLIRPEERALIIINHRTRLDWNFLWSALVHHQSSTLAHNVKLVLKDEVRIVPGLGWIMQMSRFVFIHRNWSRDEAKMGRMLNLLKIDLDEKKDENQGFQLVLFPEGTNLTEETRKKADAFADKMGRQRLIHLLQPRTTGFSFIADRMRQLDMLDAIYDVSIGYPDQVPMHEKDLFQGQVPSEIHFHFSRYNVKSDDVPSTVLGLERWLLELWQSKENRLKAFVTSKTLSNRTPRNYRLLPFQLLSLVTWMTFLHFILTKVLVSFIGFSWVFLCTVFMVAINKYSEGLNEIECWLQGVQSEEENDQKDKNE